MGVNKSLNLVGCGVGVRRAMPRALITQQTQSMKFFSNRLKKNASKTNLGSLKALSIILVIYNIYSGRADLVIH
jgi:hypothetical protein